MEVEAGDGARDVAGADHEIAKAFVLFTVRCVSGKQRPQCRDNRVAVDIASVQLGQT